MRLATYQVTMVVAVPDDTSPSQVLEWAQETAAELQTGVETELEFSSPFTWAHEIDHHVSVESVHIDHIDLDLGANHG